MDYNDVVTEMYEAVADEVTRTEYPASFPALPEVPAGRYFEPVFYKLEMDYVFGKSWLSVAHISEIPELGSYKLFERLGLSIIISRGTDDVIRAFRNSCRHRGAALFSEPTGNAKRFVCPYHSWNYATDGTLTSVPESQNFACLDKSARSLLQVRCETWRGFVFINLDDQAGQLAEYMAPLTRQVADFPIDEMIVKDVITVELDCNWKAAYDNFLEIYHVNTVHSKSLAPYLDSKSFTVQPLKHGHARLATRTRGGQSFFSDGAQEQSRTDFTTRFKEHTIGLPFFPNGFTALDPVGFSYQTFWPVGPSKCVMVATLMGWKKDDEEDRAFWKQMRVNQLNVLGEDVFLFASVQRSMQTGELKGLLLGYQEKQIYWYHEELDRRIGEHNIPADLRVTQLLAPYATD
jgi:phenylpropionate dioxygenase-like ring-hydroxylating dioxygenase large terminal subunit